MQPETAKQCMNDIGVSRENAEVVASLLASNRRDEAKQSKGSESSAVN